MQYPGDRKGERQSDKMHENIESAGGGSREKKSHGIKLLQSGEAGAIPDQE